MKKISRYFAEIGRKGGLARQAAKRARKRGERPLVSSVFPVDLPGESEPEEVIALMSVEEQKRYAHKLVTNALNKQPTLRPLSCGFCSGVGFMRICAHHQDYLKPLRVVFMCQGCHTKLHRQTVNAG